MTSAQVYRVEAVRVVGERVPVDEGDPGMAGRRLDGERELLPRLLVVGWVQRVHCGELQNPVHEDLDRAADTEDATRVVDVAYPEGELVAGTGGGGDALSNAGRRLAPIAGEVDPLRAGLGVEGESLALKCAADDRNPACGAGHRPSVKGLSRGKILETAGRHDWLLEAAVLDEVSRGRCRTAAGDHRADGERRTENPPMNGRSHGDPLRRAQVSGAAFHSVKAAETLGLALRP